MLAPKRRTLRQFPASLPSLLSTTRLRSNNSSSSSSSSSGDGEGDDDNDINDGDDEEEEESALLPTHAFLGDERGVDLPVVMVTHGAGEVALRWGLLGGDNRVRLVSSTLEQLRGRGSCQCDVEVPGR